MTYVFKEKSHLGHVIPKKWKDIPSKEKERIMHLVLRLIHLIPPLRSTTLLRLFWVLGMVYFILGNIVSTYSPSDTERLLALIQAQSRKGLCHKSGTDGSVELILGICGGKRCCLGFVVSPN